jgi:hypothetical protein
MPVRKLNAVLALSLLGVATVAAATPPAAVTQFQQLQTALQHTHAAHDWRANLVSALQLRALLNNSPDSLLEVARARVQLGDLAGAREEIATYARMGQSADLMAVSADFAPLLRSRGFGPLQEALTANAQPLARATAFLQLPDPQLLAEDLDYAPGSQQFFVTSVREHKVVTLGMDGSSRDFAAAPDGWPLLAVKVDTARGRLWVTEVALRGLRFSPARDWGRGALLCYDLASGKLLLRVEAPKDSNLGDMLLTSAGAVIVSDADGGGVYRLSADTAALQRLDRGDFISPQTPAAHPDGKHIFVPDYLRGVALLELATGRVQWLPMAGRHALSGIDGLYFTRGHLLAVQNGTSPARVTALRLSHSLTRIDAERLIERATPGLDPTHGVVVGETFYYLANSGWDAIDAKGGIKPGAMLSAARLMRVPLQAVF